ncbi:MAG: permease YjgP/YjgQ family protein [bacterium P3]|nr:MAG: permease YjgP/YjgQ family protein [bacterium P3]KWW42452.1 MAG: permease YjgP/YjgQ family protein [bacterium F083]
MQSLRNDSAGIVVKTMRLRTPHIEPRIIDRYILNKYLKTFLTAMALIIVIVITFDVSEKLDDFLEHHAPLREIVFQYYVNFIPGFVSLYSALFIFIAVIFFTSKMAGNTEIIAILGSGISYRRMLRPFLHGSVIVALAVFVFSNFVIPVSNRSLLEFSSTYIHTRRDDYFSNIHFQSEPGHQIYAESYNVQQLQAHKLHKDIYNDSGILVERHAAEQATYDSVNGTWTCRNYYHRTLDGLNERLDRAAVCQVDLGLQPEDFSHAKEHIEVMNSVELYRYIQREKMRGSTAIIGALIELYQRLLNPLAIIIMTYMGVAVSSRKTRGGIGVHLAVGISLAFSFIVFMRACVVFSTNGNLPPFLSVLLPQALYAAIAFLLVRTAPK